MQLRSYQSDVKSNVYLKWQEGLKNILAVMPTGGGKSATLACIVHEMNMTTAVIAHRQELVTQLSTALARFDVYHNIVAPLEVIKLINKLHIEEFGKSFYRENAKVSVVGVDTLLARKDNLKQWAASVAFWVTDECFPAGTLVDGVPIESLKVGDVVTGYDESTGLLGKYKVNYCFKNPLPEKMVKLTVDGVEINSTLNHPFMTKDGWKNAGDITINDEVLYHVNDLFNVRERIGSFFCNKCSLLKNRTALLWEGLFKRLSVKKIVGNNEQNKQTIRIGTDEKEQSYAFRGNEGEGSEFVKGNRSQAESAGRERSGKYTRNYNVFAFMSTWFRETIRSQNGATERKWGLPTMLQIRFGSWFEKNRDRNRRQFSLCAQSQGTGLKKGKILKWVRVESVEIYESRSDDRPNDGYVYNIEVDKVNTYLANGVVVHNCHHLLQTNKWGKATELFTNAKFGLGVTATPTRADGKGLGAHSAGVFHDMVVGPDLRWLINEGFLTDYKIYAPPSDMNFSAAKVGDSGDYNHKQLRVIAKDSHIVGDVVKHYLRLGKGKLGITFAPDIETAGDIVEKFNAAGVPAKILHGKTPDQERISTMQQFRNRVIMQIVNVDILGEGVDVPAVEVVSFARKTESFSLFVQQCGRALRPIYADRMPLDTREQRLAAIAASFKPTAIIIDHVGNIVRHAIARDCEFTGKLIIDLCHSDWTLNGRSKGGDKVDPDAIPLRTCTNPEIDCFGDYPRILKSCPYCGFTPLPTSRSAPEFVDGDLTELDPSTLTLISNKIAEVDKDVNVYRNELFAKGAPSQYIPALLSKHINRQSAQEELRNAIALWAGYQRSYGRPDSESYRRFYHKFGTDVMTAQTLPIKEALELTDKIKQEYGKNE